MEKKDVPIRNYIKELRKQRGMTAEVLASQIGVTRVSVNNIETGRQWGSADVLKKIADALGVELYELFKPSDSSKTYACPHCGMPIEISIGIPGENKPNKNIRGKEYYSGE